ncbi:hypothetical protein [Pseudodesulfovibrio sediminis]|uniref:Lipoprotein n=1 Tax=Pseudodesulfovibrio sediminis TaxID=2810563 RepID=A0ABN6EXH2_9BACT|nr:hypothetical protein [Pseudodesulfovibrio sediminis]BCS89533.1 hypothetical protein PSDVSF_27750 [Pseudodesulfovibrio sediminis]
MKRVLTVLMVSLLVSLFAGCAAKTTMIENRVENTVTYTLPETGQFVTVQLGDSYTYEHYMERTFRGVDVKGYLFMDDSGSAILVSKMPREKFEQLVRRKLAIPAKGIQALAPRTIYGSKFCDLVRAYVVTVENDVVAAVKVKTLVDYTEECAKWTTLDDVMAAEMELVTEFDTSADEAITLTWH